MLREIKDVRQIKDEPHRRWFTDEHFDLVIWDEEADIVGFQLCYDKSHGEHAITWKAGSGFIHNAVDDGEGRVGRYKGSPILVMDGRFEPRRVAAIFHCHSGTLDAKSSDFVHLKLLEYPQP